MILEPDWLNTEGVFRLTSHMLAFCDWRWGSGSKCYVILEPGIWKKMKLWLKFDEKKKLYFFSLLTMRLSYIRNIGC